jgi:hypothetical protein
MSVTQVTLSIFKESVTRLSVKYASSAVFHTRLDIGQKLLTVCIGGGLTMTFPDASHCVLFAIMLLYVCIDIGWSRPNTISMYRMAVWQLLDIMDTIDTDSYNGCLDYQTFRYLQKRILSCKIQVGDATVKRDLKMESESIY